MAQHELKSTESKVAMQVVVRDKHGNVKYAGPLVMTVENKEKEDGSHAQHCGPQRGS